MQKIIDQITQALEKDFNKKSTCVNYPGKDYKAVLFDKTYFHPIVSKPGKLTFIDGGNAELLNAVNFSLQFIRVAGVTYEGRKIIKQVKKEFFVLITSLNQDGEIHYKSTIFGEDVDFPLISSMDPAIGAANARASIGNVGNLIRRYMEIRLSDDFEGKVILDGNLKAEHEVIRQELQKRRLYALSKTNELFTDSGNSLVVELNNLAELKTWYYLPLVNIDSGMHDAQIIITKLHPASKYIFKLETPKQDDNEILSWIKNISTDPVFIGYPYGLIKADKVARVTNEEKEYLKMKFLMNITSKEKLTQYLNTMNAHVILDNIL